MKVRDLLPGVIINHAGMGATVIAVVHPHPLYRDLSLVVWRMEDGRTTSLDALSPLQEVGSAREWTPEGLKHNLRAALTGGAR